MAGFTIVHLSDLRANEPEKWEKPVDKEQVKELNKDLSPSDYRKYIGVSARRTGWSSRTANRENSSSSACFRRLRP